MKRNKEEILEDLVRNLTRMVDILQQDPDCTWTRGFEGSLADGLELKKKGCPEEEFREFCGAVRDKFLGGMGSFNDYYPIRRDPKTGNQVDIPGAEGFETLSNQIYNLANEFRIVGSY
jgi:hypothetical protein